MTPPLQLSKRSLPAKPSDGIGGTTGASIEFRDVGYRYPSGLEVIKGLDLGIGRGQSIGVVGPSGCGKSTVLSLIAGLREAQAGQVRVDPDGTGRHLLSMVFQKDTVLPWLTVEQNVRLHHTFTKAGHGKRSRQSRQAFDERIRELIAMVHLEGFEKAYPYQLSGGMRRRVAVLTAVAALPQILLLDEPFSAIDEPSRVAIHQDVFDIVRELGITMVLVTHDLAEAASMCDQVYIMGPRPTCVFSKHDVPFGAHRDMMSLRESTDFLDLYSTLWRDLHLQITAQQAGEATRVDGEVNE
ncbi:ABC transporter ATP-binding protein [Amycolatopsis pithecellobii]|uniref:ATP-binding cassette domain-containing protein n=1 Tax=Amycolatopsis pithecellobii TaxID=664692 RepID=A0A6N7YWW1_9PSEU|nr:ATP-binding cassette domain-containing protein [Amycolatopsis pithecellobii]MTD57577.1 ATP-binding cassette domain-containing protein [Amycolatopsis pithecellobii]